MHSVMLAGAWQAWGRAKAREPLILRPRLGSSLSLIRTHRHFLLFCTTCFNPLQQSMVGVLASPLTYGKHCARPMSWSEQSVLSWSMSEAAKEARRRRKLQMKEKVDKAEAMEMVKRKREEDGMIWCVMWFWVRL